MYVLAAIDVQSLISKFAAAIPTLIESTIASRLEADEIPSLKTLLETQVTTGGWSLSPQHVIIEYLGRDQFKM